MAARQPDAPPCQRRCCAAHAVRTSLPAGSLPLTMQAAAGQATQPCSDRRDPGAAVQRPPAVRPAHCALQCEQQRPSLLYPFPEIITTALNCPSHVFLSMRALHMHGAPRVPCVPSLCPLISPTEMIPLSVHCQFILPFVSCAGAPETCASVHPLSQTVPCAGKHRHCCPAPLPSLVPNRCLACVPLWHVKKRM